MVKSDGPYCKLFFQLQFSCQDKPYLLKLRLYIFILAFKIDVLVHLIHIVDTIVVIINAIFQTPTKAGKCGRVMIVMMRL